MTVRLKSLNAILEVKSNIKPDIVTFIGEYSGTLQKTHQILIKARSIALLGGRQILSHHIKESPKDSIYPVLRLWKTIDNSKPSPLSISEFKTEIKTNLSNTD